MRNCFLLVMVLCLSSSTDAAAEVVDVPAPLFDTKIKVARGTGKMLWLDAHTLAITTYLKDADYWDGKIVAVDIRTNSASILLENAFLTCADAAQGVVGLLKGSLVKNYWGPSKAGTTPDPEVFLFRWNSDEKRLEQGEKAPKAPWNPFICQQTAPEDMQRAAISFYERSVRYLQPQHGTLRWRRPPSSQEVSPISWVRPNTPPQPIDATSGEISLLAPYLPFNDTYLLTSGRFLTGKRQMTHFGAIADEFPAVTMSSTGAVHRLFVPSNLKGHLERLDPGGGETLPTAAGLLVYVGDRANRGGGVYLANGEVAKRIWCFSLKADARYQPHCTIENLELSPDGCNLAFQPREYPSNVHILKLCRPGM